PDEEARGVGRKGREQRGRVVAGWEEERRKERRERCVEIEVVPFEDGADRRGKDHAPFFARHALARAACCRYGCQSSSSRGYSSRSRRYAAATQRMTQLG